METALNYGYEDNPDGTCCKTGCNIFIENGSQWIQRVQPGAGNCFLHAQIVVQSYKLSGQSVQAVDICSYGRNALTCEQLVQFLVFDNGGSSGAVLWNILMDKDVCCCSVRDAMFTSIDDPKDTSHATCSLEKYLKEHGAGLVHHFQVGQQFHIYEQPVMGTLELPKFEGEVQPNNPDKLEFHTMVFIGMRKDSDDNWWLLLQNWWPQMQLVEVSQQYFVSSRAVIYFVCRPQAGIPENFERCGHKHAEATMEGCDDPDIWYEYGWLGQS